MKRREFFKNALAVAVPAAGCTWVALPGAGDAASGDAPLRPPGALVEEEFLSRCIRCLRCAEACPNNAIVIHDGADSRQLQGTPIIHARRQACMLCNKIEGPYLRCTEVCPSGALQVVRRNAAEVQQRVAMGKAEIDEKLCYSYNNWSCGACYRACPFPGVAMSLGLWEKPAVIAEGCVGCGLCERSCIRYPHAIRVKARTA
jgi:MauM/NapG family ferredoxin protein